MKKIIAGSLIVGSIAVAMVFGQVNVEAIEGDRGVGIVVKSGTHMSDILSQFTVTEELCDGEGATTTTMCPIILYQTEKVKVFYTAPQSIRVSQSPFKIALADFPFSGAIEYQNASVPDATKEARLIQYMQESGIGDNFTIIYEQPN
jgi:hypothetical protein